jgi:hypothetical protein
MTFSTSRRPETFERSFDQVEEPVLTNPSSRAASGVAIQFIKQWIAASASPPRNDDVLVGSA